MGLWFVHLHHAPQNLCIVLFALVTKSVKVVHVVHQHIVWVYNWQSAIQPSSKHMFGLNQRPKSSKMGCMQVVRYDLIRYLSTCILLCFSYVRSKHAHCHCIFATQLCYNMPNVSVCWKKNLSVSLGLRVNNIRNISETICIKLWMCCVQVGNLAMNTD